MPGTRARRVEDRLDGLAALRRAPVEDASVSAALREALRDRHGVVVAKAASIAGERELRMLTGDLVAAWDRCRQDPVRSDPGCLAKHAIAAALDALEHGDPRVFLEGIHCIQPEPAWGGPRDTAGEVRVACALALARRFHPDAAGELATLLADPDAAVRAGVARVIAALEDAGYAPLLRLKILLGDAEPQVTAECLTALLRVAPAPSLPFVERLLARADGDTRAAAALALGESRLRDALPLLHRYWETSTASEPRRTALLAIGMLRREEAAAFLLALVREADAPDARDALAALAIHRHDDEMRARVRAAAARRDVDLRAALEPFAD